MSASEHPSRARGFTLLELLIVMAVLGLAVTLTANLARDWGPRASLGMAAENAERLIREVRADAQVSGEVRRVEIDAEAATISAPAAGRTLAFGPGIRVSASYAGETAEASAGSILFYPDGTSTGGTLTLARDGRARRIMVHWLTGGIDAAG